MLVLASVLAPVEARAAPLLGFLGGILANFGVVTSLIGFGSIAAVNAGFAFAAFLAGPLGGLLLSAGSAALKLLFSGRQNAQNGRNQDSAPFVARIPDGPRAVHAGYKRVGGNVAYCNYDDGGNFWLVQYHGDSELVEFDYFMLDHIPVAIDGSGWVQTDEFLIDGAAQIRLWNRTYTPSDVLPPRVTQLDAAFAEWDADHKLAGTAFSVMMIKAQKPENRYKLFRWRGPVGLGEPLLSTVGWWSRVFDPNDDDQDIDDQATWKKSGNAALIWAWFRTHARGYRKPLSSIDWGEIAARATLCASTVNDKNGVPHNLYDCAITAFDDRPRKLVEAEILAACQGSILTTGEGRDYIEIGRWVEPDFTLSDKRDIIAMENSKAAVSDDVASDGVIVVYTEPDAGFTKLSSAPWKNPDYFVEGREPRFLTVEILSIEDHNQAVRVAKIIGTRSQTAYRLQPIVGPRGVRSQEAVTVNLAFPNYDGAHEIVEPPEEDMATGFWRLALVPTSAERYALAEGEEGDRPSVAIPTNYAGEIDLPTGVSVFSEPVPGSGGAAVRLAATFAASERLDHVYEFRYRKTGDTSFTPYFVLMDDARAFTNTVEDGAVFQVRWRTLTTGGQYSDWSSEVYPGSPESPIYEEVTATADTSAPGVVTSVSISSPGAGEVSIEWTAPNSANYFGARIYRHTTDDFGAATLIGVAYGSPNSADSYSETGLATDDYYYWLVAINGSGIAASEVATGVVSVA